MVKDDETGEFCSSIRITNVESEIGTALIPIVIEEDSSDKFDHFSRITSVESEIGTALFPIVIEEYKRTEPDSFTRATSMLPDIATASLQSQSCPSTKQLKRHGFLEPPTTIESSNSLSHRLIIPNVASFRDPVVFPMSHHSLIQLNRLAEEITMELPHFSPNNLRTKGVQQWMENGRLRKSLTKRKRKKL